MNTAKGFSQAIVIVLILAAVVVIGGGMFWIVSQQSQTNQNTNINSANTNAIVNHNLNFSVNQNVNENANTASNQNVNNATNQNVNISAGTNSDPTADWKTYRNEKYGFEVKYPINWKYNEKTSYAVVGFLPESPAPATPDYTYIRVKIYDNQDDLTVQDFYKTVGPIIDTEGGRLFKDYQPDGTLIINNGVVAERFNSIPGAVSFTWIVFSANSMVFEFTMPNDKSYPSIDTQTILNQLIKTFRNI